VCISDYICASYICNPCHPSCCSHPNNINRLMSCQRACPRPSLFVTVRSLQVYVEGFCAHAQPPVWTIAPCRLSATSYLSHSQLPAVFGGRVLQPRIVKTWHAVVTWCRLRW
jgi:hypothetical protein